MKTLLVAALKQAKESDQAFTAKFQDLTVLHTQWTHFGLYTEADTQPS